MQVRFRPLTSWPGDARTPAAHRRSGYTFRASWPNTLDLLERELAQLGAHDVVIEVALREDEIRIDGWPRANAYPTDPGVVISFDSRYGPLRYATDVFATYQANVRAIAVGLEALRKVDRYGITRRGEQYTGWRALPAAIALGPAEITSIEDACRILGEHADANDAAIKAMWTDDKIARAAYRTAARATHPDHGGTAADFARVKAAWDYLLAHARWSAETA